MIEFFFLVWVPFVVTVFLVLLLIMLVVTGKFNKEEPAMYVSFQVAFVEEYCADDNSGV